MTETVLTDDQVNGVCGWQASNTTMRAANDRTLCREAEQAVLQSPEIQRALADAECWRFFIGNYDEYGTVGFIDEAAFRAAINAAIQESKE